MIQIYEKLRTVLVAKHTELLEQLETKYNQYICDLLEQKSLIHKRMQHNLYKELVEINKLMITHVSKDTTKNYNEHKSSLPTATTTTVNALNINTDQPLPLQLNSDHLIDNRNKYSNIPFTILNIDAGDKTMIDSSTKSHCGPTHDDAISHPQTNNSESLTGTLLSYSDDINVDRNMYSHSNRAISHSYPEPYTDTDMNKKDVAESLTSEGNEYLKQKKYEEAIDKYTHAINIDPSKPIYFCNRALAHTQLKNYTQAIIDARMASKIDPDCMKAYIREGLALYEMCQYQDALDVFAKALNNIQCSDKVSNIIKYRMDLCHQKIGNDNKYKTQHLSQKVLNNIKKKRKHHNKKKVTFTDSLSILTKMKISPSKLVPKKRTKKVISIHPNVIESRMDIQFGYCQQYPQVAFPYIIDQNGNGKKYKCKSKFGGEYRFCDKEFTQKCHLMRHCTEKHINRRYECQYCDMKYVQNSSLKEHITVKHSNKPLSFVCPYCGGGTFTRWSSVLRHCRSQHPDKEQPKKQLKVIQVKI